MSALRRRLIVWGLCLPVIGMSIPWANATPPPGKVLRIGVLDIVYEAFDPGAISVHRALLDSLRSQGYE